MAIKAFFQRFFLGAVVTVGLIPLFYFTSVEIQIAQASAEDSSGSVSEMLSPDREIDNVAFGVGEKLEFDINYGFINGGTASMEVPKLVQHHDRLCYQIVTRANSNSFFSSFYKVEDRIESIMDAVGLYTWRFEKNLREGGYSADRIYSFDQYNNTVQYKNDTIAVPPVVQDAISALYYVRTLDLQVGKSVFVDNFTDGEHYLLEVRVLERETIEVEAGRFSCLVVEPLDKGNGVFKHEGRLKVWLTDDRMKMPVLMKAKVLVGSITAELTNYQLGDIDFF